VRLSTYATKIIMAKNLDYWQQESIKRRAWEYEGNFYGFLTEKREKSNYRGDSVTIVLREPADVDKACNCVCCSRKKER
jgi:hypothetical protein